MLIKKRLPLVLGAFFIVAGINHFLMPSFYLPLIPDYLPFKNAVNWLSGLTEVAIGIGFLWPSTRRLSGWAMAVLMILFIPSHIHFIAIGSCVMEGLCVPEWVAWLRLIVIHPLLILLGVWMGKSPPS
ncbi:MAG: hypothetical protein LAT54_08320 [Cryomorphaceae bacterium]|nr:hypothetical protein [Cryomorphaceae bacterium]